MKVLNVGTSQRLYENYPSHNHKTWEILLNVEGNGKTHAHDKVYDFKVGSIMCIPPLVYHSKIAKGGFRDVFIIVDSLPLPMENEISLFSDTKDKNIEHLMMMAMNIYYKKEQNCETITNITATLIHQMLLSWCDKKPVNENVEMLKNELVKNFTNPEYTIADANKTMHYCNDHFRRCFKDDTGVTPLTYLNNLRIEHAKQLLIQKSFSRMSITEIAYLSGFTDANYFSRLFKAKVGHPPKEFALLNNIYGKKIITPE